MLNFRRLRGPSSRNNCSLIVTGYLAGLDGSICGKRAIAAMRESIIIVVYDMRCHNMMMKFDMNCVMYININFRRLIAGCRRPVAGERKGERLD